MSMTSGEIICPFYRNDDGSRRIVCEGFVDDSFPVQQFTRKAEFLKQRSIYCADHCRCCEVYRMLVHAKYE